MKVVLDEDAYFPKRAHDTDAGYDLRTPKRLVLSPHEIKTVSTGVHIQLPKGKCGIVCSKSGLLRDYAILTTGLVDEGYTGAIGVTLINLGGNYITFERGEKIAQFYITNYYAYDLEVVEELDDTDRGERGFGSTGRT